MIEFPPPGAFFLQHITGNGGRAIAAMQAFVRGGSFWTHAGLVLDNDEIIQGQPGGAVILPLSSLDDGTPLLVSDRPVQDWLKVNGYTGESTLGRWAERLLRHTVVQEGRKLAGEKYSYLDYPVLGLAELAHAHKDNRALGWVSDQLRGYVQRSGHLICSALVDDAYLLAGIHLFNDGRMPGDVTPQDLAEYADPNA